MRGGWRRPTGWALGLLALAGCAGPAARPPLPAPVIGSEERGLASWYGEPHHGRRTSSGETYDMRALTAAHRTLPFGARVLVTNLDNGRTVEVRINDRGPFVDGRVIDLSWEAARRLGALGRGLVPVRVRVVALPDEAPAGGGSEGSQRPSSSR